jgi:hypothetical protein
MKRVCRSFGLSAKGLIFLTALIVLGLAAVDAKAELLINGGFDFPDISGSYVRYDDVSGAPDDFGWTIVWPYVDLINSLWSGVSGTSNPDGYDQSIHLLGPGTIGQVFDTTQGQTYQVSFSYSHEPYEYDIAGAAAYVVLVDGIDPYNYNTQKPILFDHVIHSQQNSVDDMKWSQYEVTFSAVSERTTVVLISDHEYNSSARGTDPADYAGFVIDDVKVISVQNAIESHVDIRPRIHVPPQTSVREPPFRPRSALLKCPNHTRRLFFLTLTDPCTHP